MLPKNKSMVKVKSIPGRDIRLVDAQTGEAGLRSGWALKAYSKVERLGAFRLGNSGGAVGSVGGSESAAKG